MSKKIVCSPTGIVFGVISMVACSVLLLGAYSCGGSSKVQPTPQVGESNPTTPGGEIENPGGFGLADPTSILASHSVADLQDGWTRDGSEFEALLPNNNLETDGDSGLFSPAYVPGIGANLDDLAYGLYIFDAADFSGDTTIHFAWETAPPDYSQLWIGVGHFQRNTWSWFQPGTANQVFLSSFAPYSRLWADGAMMVAVVMTGTQSASLNRVWLGTQVPADTIFAVPSKTLVDPGEEVLVTVYVNETALPMLSAMVRLLVTKGNEFVDGSLNAGTPGGNNDFPDGVWQYSHSEGLLINSYVGDWYAPAGYTALDLVCAPLSGNDIDLATGGLFNFRLKVNQTTELKILRETFSPYHDWTFYQNELGQSNQFWANDTYAGQPKIIVKGSPTAVFESDISAGDTPLVVNFDATGSWDEEPGNIAKYEIDFGEGNGLEDCSLGLQPEHIYEFHGEFLARLKVTDDSGLESTASIPIAAIRYDEVEDNDSPEEANTLPAYSFSGFRGNIGVDAGFQLYDGDTSDYFMLDVEPYVSYRFFGDFGNSDLYSARLVLVDRNGNWSRYGSSSWRLGSSEWIQFRPRPEDLPLTLAVICNSAATDYTLTGMRWPPTAVLRSDLYSGLLPLTVELDAHLSHDAESKEIVKYEFDFNDGSGFIDNGNNPIVSHTFTTEGLMYPKVRVFDDEGNFDIQTVTMYPGRDYDEIEPNNFYNFPQPLPIPAVDFRGSIGSLYDWDNDEYIYEGYDGSSNDYFSFGSSSVAMIHVSLSHDSSTGDLDLYLLDEEQAVLAMSESDGDFEELVYESVPGVSYSKLIQVTSHGHGGAYSDYLLNVELLYP